MSMDALTVELHNELRRYRRYSSIKNLLERGANPNISDENGFQALHIAAHFDNLIIIKILVEHGADLKSITPEGRNILHITNMQYSTKNKSILLKYLYENGVDFTATDMDGNTPLHYAAVKAFQDTLAYFLEEIKVDANPVNKEGRTPLHLAAPCRRPIILNYLIEQGANVHAKDNQGKTARHLAIQNGTTLNVVNLLYENEKKGVKNNDDCQHERLQTKRSFTTLKK